MHVIWYTATSMDGRLAGPRDDLSFLESIVDGEDEFDDFVAGVDAVLVGASTIRWLEREGHGSLPVAGKPIWVLTHDLDLAARVDDASDDVVHHAWGDVADVLADVAAAGHERLWLCGGGDVAGQALAADLVDQVTVTIAPQALGSGPALFESPAVPERRFKLDEVRRFGADAARLSWMRDRGDVAVVTR